MLDFTHANIERISAHHAGNKVNEEPLLLSDQPLDIGEAALPELLKKFFLESFEGNEFFAFDFSNGDLSLNPVWQFSKNIFEEPDSFHAGSIDLARHLYEHSTHPKIKSGDFYVVRFSGLVLGDEVLDGLGLFKSENKQSFLKLLTGGGQFALKHDEGIAVDKLDKGCLIFNTEASGGFKVCIVDKSNRSFEAQYWRDLFLHVKPLANEYYHTQHFIRMTKDFVVNKLNDDFPVEKADKINYLNKSIDYLKENEFLVEEEFAQTVFDEPNIQEAFKQHHREYYEENNLPAEESFAISSASVKKQMRGLRSVLKLDKNFHIYIHGDRELIERGFDEDKGKSFYKVYFENEE